MPRIAEGLVIHRLDLAGIGIRQRPQAPGGVERFVEETVHLDGLVTLQRQEGDFFALLDPVAEIAVLVDQPIRGPGQGVLQRVAGVHRQGSDPHFHRLEGLEMRHQLLGHDADEPGGQAALRDERMVAPAAHGLDPVGHFHVFREVEIMEPMGPSQLGHRRIAVEG